MELLWDGGTKVCSNGPGHMTKLAAMPIYGKNVKKSSLEPKGWWPWNLVCNIEYSSTIKFAQMMTLGWPWPILRQGQIWSLMLLYGKRVKQWIFQKQLSTVVYIVTVWRNAPLQNSALFLCNICPGGCMPPAPGLYTCIKSWKKCIKSDFETCNKWVKW